jgi:O-antigen/teichoic acid export membrane protein
MSQKGGDFSAHSTARGMIFLSAKNIIASVSAAIFFVLIARFLPISDLGFITGIQTLIAMFIILSGLGLAPSATRFISTFAGAGEDRKAQGLYPLIFIFSIISSAIFSALVYYLAPYISDLLFHSLIYSELVKLTSIDIFLFSIATASTFLLYASQQFLKITNITIINSVLKFSLAYILLVNGLGLQGIILGLIVGDAITLIMFVYALLPSILVKRSTMLYALSELKPLMKYSSSIYANMILNFLSTKVDVYLLLLMSSLYVVGIYSSAIFIANTFLLVLSSIDQALLPFTARMFGKSGIESFKSSSKTMSRYLFLFYFPFGFAIAVSAPSLIVIVLGNRFYDSVYATSIIVIAVTLTCMTTVFNNLLRAAGSPGTILKANIFALLIQLSISIGTIPYFETIGVAIARAVSRIILQVYPARKLSQLGALDYDKVALKNGIIGSAIICIAIISMSNLITEPYFLPITYIIAGIAYLLFLRKNRAMNSRDIDFINKILLGKMKWLTVVLAKIVIR